MLVSAWASARFVLVAFPDAPHLERLTRALLHDERFGVLAEPETLASYGADSKCVAHVGLAEEAPVASLAAEAAVGAQLEPLTARADDPPPPVGEAGGWAAAVRVRLSSRLIDGGLELLPLDEAKGNDVGAMRVPCAAWGTADAAAVKKALRVRGFVVEDGEREGKRAKTTLVALSAKGSSVHVTPGAAKSHITGEDPDAVLDAADAVLASLPRVLGSGTLSGGTL